MKRGKLPPTPQKYAKHEYFSSSKKIKEQNEI